MLQELGWWPSELLELLLESIFLATYQWGDSIASCFLLKTNKQTLLNKPY